LLAGLRGHLAETGSIAIAVPNCERDPIKLLVADHCTHFNYANLARLLSSCGFAATNLEVSNSSREVLILARPSGQIADSLTQDDWIQASLDCLTSAKRNLDGNLKGGYRMAVFGTSIAGAWVMSEYPDRIDVFVDEDQTRQGQSFNGKEIVAPFEVPTTLPIIVPPMGLNSETLVERLRHQYPSLPWVMI